jgi:tetratricopeptide (TPR) repeat protein
LKKGQYLLLGVGLILFCLVYFFGNTIPPKAAVAQPATEEADHQHLTSEQVLAGAKQKLSATIQSQVNSLESAVVRGNVKEQQIDVYRQLAALYRDSAHLLLPFAYYTGEAAKLENSQKSLTFAAHLFLNNLRGQEDPSLKEWMAVRGKELFEKALKIDPANDSLKVGLGSCYLFGNIDENPMQGVQIIREVAERDPENMYAQLNLAIGGMISGQMDKAIERLQLVASKQPQNAEALVMLAEAYERKGDKKSAVAWYEKVKPLVPNAEILKEIDQRIELLKRQN